MTSKRLVVVEDDHDMVELISALLSTDTGLAIAGSAVDAEEAMAAVTAARPDLIILDHFIEGDTTGLELAPRLREAVPDARILLFTSHDLRAEAARESAIDRYLNKSEVGRLLAACHELLG